MWADYFHCAGSTCVALPIRVEWLTHLLYSLAWLFPYMICMDCDKHSTFWNKTLNVIQSSSVIIWGIVLTIAHKLRLKDPVWCWYIKYGLMNTYTLVFGVNKLSDCFAGKIFQIFGKMMFKRYEMIYHFRQIRSKQQSMQDILTKSKISRLSELVIDSVQNRCPTSSLLRVFYRRLLYTYCQCIAKMLYQFVFHQTNISVSYYS